MFYDKFFDSLNLNELSAPFNFFCFGWNYFCLEGKCTISLFSSVKIVLSLKKQQVFICGNNLSIKDMDKGHITIVGNIETISSKEQ